MLRVIVLILPIHLILAIGIFYNMEVCATKNADLVSKDL